MDKQIKQLLGDYAFAVAALQHQVETITKELEDLKKSKKESK